MKAPVRKAVFPVAGLGTRFLPATKSVPKEMLTVVDRPVLQYAVDEAREAGITHFIFVTGRNKAVIEDYFDIQYELETTLRERGKTAALDALQDTLPEAGTFSFTRQQVPLGLGHAIWCARDLVGNEPFAVLLPDMLLQGSPGCLKSMMEVYEETGGNVIAVGECDPKLVSQYGIVGIGEKKGGAFRITSMVEKPKPADAPSNRYINGRYIFQPELFEHLASFTRGAGGEIQVTDAMIELAAEQPFHGWTWPGRTYDCGSKAGYFAATFAYAIARDDLLPALAAEIDAHASMRQDGTIIDIAVDPALQGLREIVQRRLNAAGPGRRKA